MPRQKVEYRCPECQEVMPKKRARCDKCKERVERYNQGWRPIPTRTGSVEAQLPSASAHGAYTFRQYTQFRDDGPLAPFIQGLIRLTAEGTEYIPAAHRGWLQVLLYELSQFKTELAGRVTGFENGKGAGTLYRLLHWWMSNVLREDGSPAILPHFALATCEFVTRHFAGHRKWAHEGGEAWELIGATEDEDAEYGERFYDRKTQLRAFTQTVCPIVVRAVVPPGCKLRARDVSGAQEFGPGHSFDFSIVRCWLSGTQDANYYGPRAYFSRSKRRFDILEDFLGPGILRMETSNPNYAGSLGRLPFEWVTAECHWDDRGNETWVPLPDWLRPKPELNEVTETLTLVRGERE